jgi:hypothetical protein
VKSEVNTNKKEVERYLYVPISKYITPVKIKNI